MPRRLGRKVLQSAADRIHPPDFDEAEMRTAALSKPRPSLLRLEHEKMMSDFPGHQTPPVEKLLNLQEAADAVGARYWALQGAVKRGDIPSYTPFNSRKRVKLSEVVAYIDASRQGGK